MTDMLRAMRVVRPDDLAARRRRQRLLATLTAISKASARPPAISLARWFAAGASLAFFVCAVALFVKRLPTRNSGAVAESTFVVDVEPRRATWMRRREGSADVVVLDDGQLFIRSSRKGPEDRLVVRVPDGEIEDVGTRFAVMVVSGRTERIDVFEGVVVFHRKGESDRTVHAGGHYELWPSPVSSAPLPLVDAGTAFAAAMFAFRGGQFSTAASAFERFVVEFPSDPRSENAVYLRALAYAQIGDDEGAARVAREYLIRYPHGLRRIEAARLAK